jgi:cytochrome c-type biogenesis protein CcmE
MATKIKIPDALVIGGVGTIDLSLFAAPTTIAEGADTQVAQVKAVGMRVTGNVEHGAVSAFATTEPVSAATFKTGTAPAGAVTTSAGVFSNGTLMRKIIADGTVSDIQT